MTIYGGDKMDDKDNISLEDETNSIETQSDNNEINLLGGTEMAVATDFNTGSGVKAVRKLLMTFVDVSDSETPEWEILGRGTEDSSIELNPNTETVTDILGITDTSVTKWEPSQSFEPNTVRGGSKLNFKLHKIWQDKTPEKLSQFDVMIVYAYISGDTTSTFEAEVQKNCTININSLGGDAYVDMPIEITFSNDIDKGTASKTGNDWSFTKAS